ncbi:PREDICTED: protein VARIATION IN COMPOUND TRIGGERED ROOT growth response-like [Camelina sativa]|uniref:Protein VARIATION IN COMPOUND TRIGGERED ROOT growth response-like n=1 Tax=Camelina sativa TaxID=90675 RepID=A0ABM0Y5W6_CAMSA|nr:PREDICTED: protein VARIATION IN COMPOUND TRIGGERED ROOT growth response-like [Camelina sativa]
MASSSAPRNWLYDVFLSFRGEDVRVTFRSHFLKELDRKLITAFKDNEIERSKSLSPELVQAIKNSRIAVVVFSKNYASSRWCLNELLEIVNCKDKIVIPVFYGLDPSHVRYQTGEFGRIFKKTCKRHTEKVGNQWKEALADVASRLGFDSARWDNEAKMIEVIANDVSGKLLPTTWEDSEDLVGIGDHMEKMSGLLELESMKVKMVGIWGSSGIGKTTIARALFNRISSRFQGSIFIDRAFVSRCMENYGRANPDDWNMKLHLQRNFLSVILEKKDVKIDHLGAVGERLKQKKVLIVIDDLDDLVVLDVLAGKTEWFGSGSRIIVATNDKHLLMAHRIDQIYEVHLPSEGHAHQMFCQSAFRKDSPPEGFGKLVVKVARQAGKLPLGLNVLGSYLRGRDKDYWMDMLPRLQSNLDGKIEKTLRFSYDGLDSEKDKAIFRHITCLFNDVDVTDIKLLLADSNLDVNIGLKHLVEKSLVHVRRGKVEMQRLLQDMGRNIVRIQSEPGKREFLVDSKDICHVLNAGTGTEKVLGISQLDENGLGISQLDTSEFHLSENKKLDVHESAFKGMPNLRFLEINGRMELHLPESFDYLPPKLKLLCWPNFPMRCMPSSFRPENLIKLKMQESKLHKLWEGVVSLAYLKEMDLSGSSDLKEIPDLSMATNLETLNLEDCESLVELTSSIRNLNKLLELFMRSCTSLEIIPTGFNLKSLDYINFDGCSKLRTFPEFSTNISALSLLDTNIEEFPSNLHLENLSELNISSDGKQWEGVKPLTPFLSMLSPTLKYLSLSDIPSLVELPCSFQNLNQLKRLTITNCTDLETLPTGINLESLEYLCFNLCSRLRSFPDISTNISRLDLVDTGIEEVSWWIEKFTKLTELRMGYCSMLKSVSMNISNMKQLKKANFSDCGALTRVDLSGYPSGMVEMMEASSCLLPHNCVPKVELNLMGCFILDPVTVLRQQSFTFNSMRFSAVEQEVPSYFKHRTSGSSSLTIPLLHVPLSQPFFMIRIRVGVLTTNIRERVHIMVKSEFKDRFGNSLDCDRSDFVVPVYYPDRKVDDLTILDYCIPLKEDNALPQGNDDHVAIRIRQTKGKNIRIKGWGVQLLDDCSSPENRLGNPDTTLPHVSEAEERLVQFRTFDLLKSGLRFNRWFHTMLFSFFFYSLCVYIISWAYHWSS